MPQGFESVDSWLGHKYVRTTRFSGAVPFMGATRFSGAVPFMGIGHATCFILLFEVSLDKLFKWK